MARVYPKPEGWPSNCCRILFGLPVHIRETEMDVPEQIEAQMIEAGWIEEEGKNDGNQDLSPTGEGDGGEHHPDVPDAGGGGA